mmetsp:Transcript_11107/g.18170  ORF Transcript_11107/g.18170 Transcript_11107/m.18170 type:complete len:209 (+) Transcript_11107:404-1030(+)
MLSASSPVLKMVSPSRKRRRPNELRISSHSSFVSSSFSSPKKSVKIRWSHTLDLGSEVRDMCPRRGAFPVVKANGISGIDGVSRGASISKPLRLREPTFGEPRPASPFPSNSWSSIHSKPSFTTSNTLQQSKGSLGRRTWFAINNSSKSSRSWVKTMVRPLTRAICFTRIRPVAMAVASIPVTLPKSSTTNWIVSSKNVLEERFDELD